MANSSLLAILGRQKKTLLIGFDLRRPNLPFNFALSGEAGLSTYLIGKNSLEDIVFETDYQNLHVIPAGPIPPNPSELLMTDSLEELINLLKEKYDYIILDSPPMGLVSDPLALSKYVDATVYVVRQNYTKKGMFSLINDKYKKGEVTNLSLVLNFVDNKSKYGYGYGGYYPWYGYGGGYWGYCPPYYPGYPGYYPPYYGNSTYGKRNAYSTNRYSSRGRMNTSNVTNRESYDYKRGYSSSNRRASTRSNSTNSSNLRSSARSARAPTTLPTSSRDLR